MGALPKTFAAGALANPAASLPNHGTKSWEMRAPVEGVAKREDLER